MPSSAGAIAEVRQGHRRGHPRERPVPLRRHRGEHFEVEAAAIEGEHHGTIGPRAVEAMRLGEGSRRLEHVRTRGLRSRPSTTPSPRASRSCIASIEGSPAAHAEASATSACCPEYCAASGRATAARSIASLRPTCRTPATTSVVPA
jgi:hypothetical protein